MRVLAISGSLQAGSSNTALLRQVRALAPNGTEVVLYQGLVALPRFNPDLDADPAVAELRTQLLGVDAVLIASPEYAHEMPGSLKNALDWVVGSGELYGKPVAILSAAPSAARGQYAREALERTLGAQGAKVVASMTVPVAKDQPLDDPQIVQAVRDVLTALAAG
ncbi:MAG TPA: NAD(P)H-dependent oxidoreductase [Acidimicrobiales bacterium]|nr:NAD(P)H-dependent oxidoreductase [Acidimicrobiales bacterium]